MKKQDFIKGFPGKLVRIPDAEVAFVPEGLPPEIELETEIIQANDAALLALGGLKSLIPVLPNPNLFTSPFLRREAVLSSRIEGTKTNVDQLYLFEAEAAAAGDSKEMGSEKQEDAREVFNYVRALNYGLNELKKLPICNRLLKEMHIRLLEGVAKHRGSYSRPGQFRTTQVYIGSSTIQHARYVPPPGNAIEDLMKSLERYINQPQGRLPKLVNIALVHYQFEAIHPFEDGNGRIGRLLISLMLASYGILSEPLLYISAYLERNRQQYVSGMWEISRAGAWADWVLFFLKGVETEAIDAMRRARQLLELRENYRQMFQSSPGKLLNFIDSLFEYPVVSVSDVQKCLELKTYRGAQKNVVKLIEAGVLEEEGKRQRNRLYVARQIVNLVSAEE